MTEHLPVHAHGGCCDDCEPSAPVRNHYFSGKLLVERDFTDEQFYFREKLRLHNQRLHGVGIVCGLDIVAHPNPACRDRMVVLKAGSAIDCCGHDILVVEDEILVLDEFPAIQALKALQGDDADHRLTFCLKYRECPTEEIPVLFDECGCDDTQCAPNRVLESFEIDIRVDDPLPEKPFHAPVLAWASTIGIAHAAFFVIDAPRNRAFALTGEDAATLYEIDLTNQSIVASAPLATKALAMAVSEDGKAVAIASRPAASPNDPITLSRFDPDAAGGIGVGAAKEDKVPGTGAGGASLVATSAGFVFLGQGNGVIATYAPDIADPAVPAAIRTIGAARIGPALADAATAWLGEPATGKLWSIDLTQTTLPETAVTVAGVALDRLAFIKDGAGARLLAVDNAAKLLRLIDPVAGTLVGSSAALAVAPAQVIPSPDGRWAWVVLDDGTAATIASVDVNRIREGETPSAIGAIPVGRPVGALALSPAGETLYLPYTGDLTATADGGIAVIGITETDCWGVLEGKDCPGCVVPDCLILATVEGYRIGRKLEDLPGDPVNDPANGIARIDNDTWRTILPSTQAIAQALLCLKDGVQGAKGDKGDTGPEGKKGDQGDQGPQGPSGLDDTLTHICTTSWDHRGEVKLTSFRRQGIVIGFDREVFMADIFDKATGFSTIEVQVAGKSGDGRICWCDWPPEVIEGLKFNTPCEIDGQFDGTGNPLVDGIRWLPSGTPEGLFGTVWIRVILHCDLIADKDKRSVDGNHLSPWISQANPGVKSGDGVAGGTFESMFFVRFPTD